MVSVVSLLALSLLLPVNIMHIRQFVLLFTTSALLVACASPTGFRLENVDRQLTPSQAAAAPDRALNQKVLWGGVIVNSRNLKQSTEIEVLPYPLDEDQRPDIEATPGPRFLLEQAGYLETADYAAGREVSVVGTVTGTIKGKIGDADYIYVRLRAEQLHLWPKERPAPRDPQFHFGIGIILH